jgi:hypothetical protein
MATKHDTKPARRSHRKSTTAQPESVRVDQVRRGAWLRRIPLTLLVVYVALGAFGVLGERTSTVETTGEYRLRVTYPATIRSGTDADWSISVRHPGGFDDGPRIGIDRTYLKLFRDVGLAPQPSSETTSGPWALWEFDPPGGDELVVQLHTQTASNVYAIGRGKVAVMDGTKPVAQVHFRTKGLP